MKNLLIKLLFKVEYLFGDVSHYTDRIKRYITRLRWRVEGYGKDCKIRQTIQRN
jgi:hypothetical protein